MSTLALVGLAFLLGMRHATDADHVVAVTAIASRHRRIGPAVLTGIFWGLGHTLTIAVVGGLIITFNIVVPPRVGLAFEFAVGLALTVIGALNVTARSAPHVHDDVPASSLRAFVLGLLHGLAGSAAVALLVLATVRDPNAALAYLLVFGVGTLLGMALITVSLASSAVLAAHRVPWSGRALRLATGVLSLAFGLYVLVHVGWIDGLFRGAAHWFPR